MKIDFKDMTVGEFARGIGAEFPLAGGGSVTDLSGGYGAALVSMVFRKSILNKKYDDVNDSVCSMKCNTAIKNPSFH